MYEYKAAVVRVVDGDTVDVRIDLGFSIGFETRLRLLGINTSELHAPDPAERERARAGAAMLSSLLPVGSVVQVHTQKDRREKYGRYLARVVTADGTDAAAALLAAGLARVM